MCKGALDSSRAWARHLGLLLFGLMALAQPALGQGISYGQFSCRDITWSSMNLRTPVDALQFNYDFEGSWGQGADMLFFKVNAWYIPDPARFGWDWYPGAGSGGRWEESVFVRTLAEKTANAPAKSCLTTKGQSPQDPWINAGAAISGAEVLPFSSPYCSMFGTVVDKPLSACAPTPELRLQWELAFRNALTACQSTVLCAPQILRPAVNQTFGAEPATVGFEFLLPGCKFSNYEGKFFNVITEWQDENGDWTVPGWMPYMNAVQMHPYPGQLKSVGGMSQLFDRPGRYRVRVNTSIFLDHQTWSENPQLAARGDEGETLIGIVSYREFRVGPSRMAGMQESARRLAVGTLGQPDGPDLVVENLQLREILPGETYGGATYETRHAQVTCEVVNRGNAPAGPSVLTIAAWSHAGGAGAAGVSGAHAVPDLAAWDAGDPDKSRFVAGSEIVEVTGGDFTWWVAANADKYEDVEEANEGNNRQQIEQLSRGAVPDRVAGSAPAGALVAAPAPTALKAVVPTTPGFKTRGASSGPGGAALRTIDASRKVTAALPADNVRRILEPRFVSPQPSQNFPENTDIPLRLEFPCCLAQQGDLQVMDNYFEVEIQRYTWNSPDTQRVWLPAQAFSVPMTPCGSPGPSCEGARNADLSETEYHDPANAPPADSEAFRVRARAVYSENPEESQTKLNGAWTDYLRFDVRPNLVAAQTKAVAPAGLIPGSSGQDAGPPGAEGRTAAPPAALAKEVAVPIVPLPDRRADEVRESGAPLAVAKPVPARAPVVRVRAASFPAPSLVKLTVEAEEGFKVLFVLRRKSDGAYREIARSERPEFLVKETGDYQVTARYEGGGADGAAAAFTVKSTPALKKTPAMPQSQKIKAR